MSRKSKPTVQSFFAFAFEDDGLMRRRERMLRRAGVAKPKKRGGRGNRKGSGRGRDVTTGQGQGPCHHTGTGNGKSTSTQVGRPREHHYTPPEIAAKIVAMYKCGVCGNRVSLSPCVICAGLKEARREGKSLPWWEEERVQAANLELAASIVAEVGRVAVS